MKRLYIFLLSICFCCVMTAQQKSLLEDLRQKMAGNSSVISYEYVLEADGIRTGGSGVLTTQDQAYRMSGNGLDIMCNGTAVWVMDTAGKEVVIESVAEGTDAYMMNPALLFTDLESLFNVGTPVSDGALKTYSLTPKASCGISSGKVSVDNSGKVPVFSSGSFCLSDGSSLTIKIKSMTFSEKKPLTFYTLDISGLDSSWMITDLR